MNRDVMERLADARPDALDPAPDPARRARDLARATSGARERRRFAFARPRMAVVALAVGAVAAAGIVVTEPDGAGGPAPRPGARTTATDARTVLLAAAQQAEKEPTGRYWRVETLDGQAYHVGPPDGGYNVIGYSTHGSQWWARSKKDLNVFYSRDVGARPLEPRDEAAWRAAGSPTTFPVVSNGEKRTLSTVPGRTKGVDGDGTWSRSTDDVHRFSGRKWLCGSEADPSGAKGSERCGREPSGEEMERIAADPARLRLHLFPWLGDARSRAERKPYDSPATRLMTAFRFLVGHPVSPKTRAAVFRLLADEPGVRSLGRVKDPRGRTGIALAARGATQDTGSVLGYQLILDPATHRLLGGLEVVLEPRGENRGMRPGAVYNQELLLSIGWTDDEPRHP